MKIKKEFSKIFNVVLTNYKTKIILAKLEMLYEQKIFNKEIILNVIKLLIISFNIDKNSYQKYNQFFDYLLKNKKSKFTIFINNYKLDYQSKLNEHTINSIIIYINYIIINCNDYNKLTTNIVTILKKLKLLNIGFDNKLILFYHFVSNIDNDDIDTYVNDIYKMVNIFINGSIKT